MTTDGTWIDNKDRPKTIGVDLDGTLLEYGDGWKGPDHFGAPIEGAPEAMKTLKELGWRIIIITTRGDEEKVAAALSKHGIPFDHINTNPDPVPDINPHKPLCDIYIGDEALPFRGSWGDSMLAILGFNPWWKK